MDLALLGWPADGPTLSLDHERFAYAGKFVMSSTGKAVARDGEDVVAATAFDADRTDDSLCRIRYVTVRADRRGEGLGPKLLRFTAECAREHGFDEVRIAVNNPYAYEAAYRAGFAFTGEATGLAELVLAWPAKGVAGADYEAGLDRFVDRNLSEGERTFVADARETGPPPTVDDGG